MCDVMGGGGGGLAKRASLLVCCPPPPLVYRDWGIEARVLDSGKSYWSLSLFSF